MSIINDALKKAQKLKGQLTAGHGSKDEQPQSTVPNQDIAKKTDSASKTFDPKNLSPKKIIIIVVAVIFGLFLLNKLIFRPKKVIYISKDDIVKLKESETPAKTETSKPIAVSQKPKTTRITPAEQKPEPEPVHQETVTIRPSEMNITGIVTGSGEPFAIINDQVYKEGDSVGNAKIIKISEGKITFDYSGRKMTFTINR